MLTIFYLHYSGHVGWFWTSKRVAGLEVRKATQDIYEVMEDA